MIKWVPIERPEMPAFAELYEQSCAEVTRMCAIPPHIIKGLDRTTFSLAEDIRARYYGC